MEESLELRLFEILPEEMLPVLEIDIESNYLPRTNKFIRNRLEASEDDIFCRFIHSVSRFDSGRRNQW
jgi:hypothetical protein